MPLAVVYSNLKDSDFKSGFEQRLTQLIAEVFDKPPERVVVTVEAGKRMTKGGTDDPNVLFQLRSIAVFDESKNPNYFPKIFKFFEDEVNVPKGRTVIEFVDIPKYMAGSQLVNYVATMATGFI